MVGSIPKAREESSDHVVRSAGHLVKYERYILRHAAQGAYMEMRTLAP